MASSKNTVVLCILDGWGISPVKQHNAIALARTPFYDYLVASHPYAELEASGPAVGLPEGQMGNSEVGHITIGAGRIIWQDLPRITNSFASGQLPHHPLYRRLVQCTYGKGGICHLIGIISDGGVHGHIDHVLAIARMLKREGIRLKLHAITDGRDTPPHSSGKFMDRLSEEGIEIASISGRFYAMDRDRRYERTELAYQVIACGNGPRFQGASQAIGYYQNNNTGDEFILPSVIGDYGGFAEGDAVVFFNFRADRMRQLAAAIADPSFTCFEVKASRLIAYHLSFTEYSTELSRYCHVLFPKEQPKHTLGGVINDHGFHQLRIAETEKYAHITYFLNGGEEKPFAYEDRILIPSPKVLTYDLKPQMSAPEITMEAVEAIRNGKHRFICLNYANADMVGHTGNLEAALSAAETVDDCLSELCNAARLNDAEVLITADHGNAECMLDVVNNQPLTSHTANKVPGIYFGRQKLSLRKTGIGLMDIAPTVLDLLGLPKPAEMLGASLISRC